MLCHVIEIAYDCTCYMNSTQERLRLHRAAQIAKLEVTLVSLRQRLTVLENLKAVGGGDSGATDLQIEGDEGDLLEDTPAIAAAAATVGHLDENVDLDSTLILESTDMEYPQIGDYNQYDNSLECISKTRPIEEHVTAGGGEEDNELQYLHETMDVCDNYEGNIEPGLETTASHLKHSKENEEGVSVEVTDVKEHNYHMSSSDARHTQESITEMCNDVVDIPSSRDHSNQSMSICDRAMTGEGAVGCELSDPTTAEMAVKEVAVKGAVAGDIDLHFDYMLRAATAITATTSECAATSAAAGPTDQTTAAVAAAAAADQAAAAGPADQTAVAAAGPTDQTAVAAAVEELGVQRRQDLEEEDDEEVEQLIVQAQQQELELEQEHVQEVHIPVEVIGPLEGNIIDPALVPVVRNNWHRMALLRRAIRAFETLLRDPEAHPDAGADAEGEDAPEPLRAINFDPIDLLHFFALHFTVLLLTLILGFWLLLCRVLPIVVVHLLCITEYLHKLSYDIVEWMNDTTAIHLVRPHTEESVEWWIECFHSIELTAGFGILITVVFILGKELVFFSSLFFFSAFISFSNSIYFLHFSVSLSVSVSVSVYASFYLSCLSIFCFT